jgi:hypothetical protein
MTNRFFLFNKLTQNNINDEYVIDWINKSFSLHMINNTSKVSQLGKRETRSLNEYETCFTFDENFDMDFNFFSSPITTSQRLKIGSFIFHSQDYSKVGPRKSNYIIAYSHQNRTNYGIIKYFLQIREENYLAINNLKIISNLYENIGARTNVLLTNLRNTGAFDLYFCDCHEIENLIFIHWSQVIAKCIAIKNSDGHYSISELIDNPDHT